MGKVRGEDGRVKRFAGASARRRYALARQADGWASRPYLKIADTAAQCPYLGMVDGGRDCRLDDLPGTLNDCMLT